MLAEDAHAYRFKVKDVMRLSNNLYVSYSVFNDDNEFRQCTLDITRNKPEGTVREPSMYLINSTIKAIQEKLKDSHFQLFTNERGDESQGHLMLFTREVSEEIKTYMPLIEMFIGSVIDGG